MPHNDSDENPVRGSSYVAVAYSSIRHLIFSGELPEGSRVTVRPLADRLQLSPTPIRSALAALERQGLLEVREHRGYFVPVLSREDMLEIYEIREEIESIASRRAATLPSREAIVAELQDLLERQRSCIRSNDIESYGDLDVAFHKTIWRASGNRRLLSVSDTLLGQVRIGNNISARAPGRADASLTEHAEIIDALRRGDAKAAEHATRNHVRRASLALAELLESD